MSRVHLLTILVVGVLTACSAPPPDLRKSGFAVSRPGFSAKYDEKSGRLKRIDIDQNKNGRMDTWSYWDGTRVQRIEVDKDEDGRVDRWEHYDAANQLTSVGSSSRDDGTEDTWAYPDASGFLAKVETDSDRDGSIDKRELFVQKPGVPGSRVLSVVEQELDRTGRPRLTLHYTPEGQISRVEQSAR